jgi:pimeloyl-ACP methyl ester carboxylesterase
MVHARHETRLVPVADGVSVEVVDWGGSGAPMVFLAGFGGTAHDFDDFAPRFTSKHHVYGVTRRGFGASTAPAPTLETYDPDRLGDDILAVVAALKLDHPVLVGHSIAGQELSSIGTRHPEAVAGLIYLEASDHFAFYDPASAVLYPNAAAMRRDLERLPKAEPAEARRLVAQMLELLPRLKAGLDWYGAALEGATDQPAEIQQAPLRLVQNAMVDSEKMYRGVNVPVLALVAAPPKCAPNCATPGAQRRAATAAAQADAFARGNAQARVVRLPFADHFIHRSNADQVAREMDAFMDGLARPGAKPSAEQR